MNSREVLQKAYDGGYAIGAFNASNFEVLKAIMLAAEKLKSPVIVETSEGETAYVTPRVMAAMTKAYRDKLKLPILLNLDHAHSFGAVEAAANAGYQLLHFDGSKLPLSENIRLLRKIVIFAHQRGDLVEGEMDRITGRSEARIDLDALQIQKQGKYTDPEKAQDFVKKSGVDIFAAFFGNVHGVYRTSPKLDLQLLAKIREALPCFLSFHGASGIAAEDLKKAIQIGKIVKVNFNTELRMAYRKNLEKRLAKTATLALYEIMPPVIEAVQKVVEEKIKLLNADGKA